MLVLQNILVYRMWQARTGITVHAVGGRGGTLSMIYSVCGFWSCFRIKKNVTCIFKSYLVDTVLKTPLRPGGDIIKLSYMCADIHTFTSSGEISCKGSWSCMKQRFQFPKWFINTAVESNSIRDIHSSCYCIHASVLFSGMGSASQGANMFM